MASRLSVLLVDDDANIRRTLALSLKDLDCSVEVAASVNEALAKSKTRPYDLILTDFRMGAQNGLELVRAVRQARPEALLAIMTAFATFENAVETVREGAFDYLPKPFTTPQLAHLLVKVRQITALRQENRALRGSQVRRDYFSGLTSVASQRLEEFTRKVAPTEGTVLLTGESGTGKSELAKLIHELSPRAPGPFVTVYCTTLTESLLESELFGHVKGAFTGAAQDHAGKLEQADGGTLFLDEVGELSASGQTKLLRFLQERVFERVGAHQPIAVNTRVIAATNQVLSDAVAGGRFREDLFYRLNVLECILPPLRHRQEDLPVLIDRLTRELSPGREVVWPAQVQARLLAYRWPGNLRELRNALERAILLSNGREIREADLPAPLLEADTAASPGPLRTLEDVEKSHILATLAQSPSLESAAQALGITTVTLWRKRKEYGIS